MDGDNKGVQFVWENFVILSRIGACGKNLAGLLTEGVVLCWTEGWVCWGFEEAVGRGVGTRLAAWIAELMRTDASENGRLAERADADRLMGQTRAARSPISAISSSAT